MTELKNIKLGVDIGANAVKILEVSGQSGSIVLNAFGYKNIKSASRTELPGIIKELAAQAKISSREAAISVSGQSVIVRFIKMPKMDDQALKGAIRFEAEKFIPFDINSCIIDHKILKKKDADNKLNIVLVAAKKEVVMDKIRLAEEAGFQVRIVDIDSFAIANSFLKNFPKLEQDKTTALINIGASTSNLCILRNDNICFARDIAVASDDFTAAVAKRMGIEPKAAESLIADPKEKAQDVLESMKNAYSNLMEEIRLSFNYYENQDGRGIDDIYISGGSMNTPGLNDMFKESLGSNPLPWKPLDFLNLNEADKQKLADTENSFAIAAGLILR